MVVVIRLQMYSEDWTRMCSLSKLLIQANHPSNGRGVLGWDPVVK